MLIEESDDNLYLDFCMETFPPRKRATQSFPTNKTHTLATTTTGAKHKTNLDASPDKLWPWSFRKSVGISASLWLECRSSPLTHKRPFLKAGRRKLARTARIPTRHHSFGAVAAAPKLIRPVELTVKSD